MYRGYVPIAKGPACVCLVPRIPSCWEDPPSWAVQGADVSSVDGNRGRGPGGAGGRGQGHLMYLGTHRSYLVYTTMSSAPRVCSELELQGTGSTYPGPWFRHTSSFGGLCSRALSYRVSRLPPSRLVWSLVSILRISSVKLCTYLCPSRGTVRTLARCNTAKHRTDSLILLAGMLPPPWVRQPTWALTCPGVAQASPPPASSLWLNNTYISRSLANTLSHPESSSGVHDHTQTQRNNHLRLSYLKAS